jgi:hypothetical protein
VAHVEANGNPEVLRAGMAAGAGPRLTSALAFCFLFD